MTHIDELRDVIHHLHGAKASHVHSVPVKRSFRGRQFGTASSRYLTLLGIRRQTESMPGCTTQTTLRSLSAM
jgi:hypothetical protein